MVESAKDSQISPIPIPPPPPPPALKTGGNSLSNEAILPFFPIDDDNGKSNHNESNLIKMGSSIKEYDEGNKLKKEIKEEDEEEEECHLIFEKKQFHNYPSNIYNNTEKRYIGIPSKKFGDKYCYLT